VAGLAVIVFLWVGFNNPPGLESKAGGVQADANKPADVNRPADVNAPVKTDANAPRPDANRPPEMSRGSRGSRPPGMGRGDRPGPDGRPEGMPADASASSPQGKPADPNAAGSQLEAVNLKDVEMKNVVEKIATWTGKIVLPSDEALKQKITIYAPEKLPRSKALATIYSALRMKGFVAEDRDNVIHIVPIKEAKLGVVPTISADEPLAMYENKDQIVRKFFKLAQYSPGQMLDVVKPLIGDYGYVGADEATGQLLVIDTVGNLMMVAKMIAELDIPGAGKSIDEIFEIQYGDPAEIIQLMRLLMGDTASGQRGSATINRPTAPRPSSSGGPTVAASGQTPLVLIPVAKRKVIMARGSAADIEMVRGWIKKLDREDPIRSEYETIPLRYADTQEVAQRIEEALANMPGAEGMRPSIMVRALRQSRQVMVIGRKDLREMVKGLIAEIDMPTGTFETKVFPLKHADPDQIKANIESLYSESIPGGSSNSSAYYYYYAYGPGGRTNSADTVKVIAFPTMKQVTVIASPENMRKIEKQMEEWDTPLDVSSVRPRIVELRNSDPVAMVKLLTSLFSDKQDNSSALLRYILYDDMGDQKKKIVGPLYGQLTFESVTGTKKIIIVSKIPAAYDVVEQLVYDLDRQEMGETPTVVQLKYADAEDLSERLNATFNSEGTSARIRRTSKGLSQYSMEQSASGGNNGNGGGSPQNLNSNSQNSGNANEYTPPWSAGGARRSTDTEPISNVIGRVRFVPDPRTKSILVLSPREFQGEISKTIAQLDVPGKQLLIKAIIVEVDHSSMTSLGIQLATNPNAFGNIGENAMTALAQVANRSEAGSTIGGGAIGTVPLSATGSGTVSGGTASVYALIDFLIKKTNAKILNQQTLWTEDNEEAMFFKGQVVAFTDTTTLTGTGASQQGVSFKDVGMVVQVRPSITPEKHVDLTVRLQMSQLTAEFVNSQPIRDKMETSTNMIVQDGETVILGGMLFQTDSRIKRKIPLLGDLPLIGGLFQHNSAALANNELFVFVTPYVIDNVGGLSDQAKEQVETPKNRLDAVREQLDLESEMLKEDVEKP
jgi:general secretion pathway protein D